MHIQIATIPPEVVNSLVAFVAALLGWLTHKAWTPKQ
jgi:hypothetical protein